MLVRMSKPIEASIVVVDDNLRGPGSLKFP